MIYSAPAEIINENNTGRSIDSILDVPPLPPKNFSLWDAVTQTFQVLRKERPQSLVYPEVRDNRRR